MSDITKQQLTPELAALVDILVDLAVDDFFAELEGPRPVEKVKKAPTTTLDKMQIYSRLGRK